MILLTAAFPFAPARLGTAHFASTYIPADICYRLLRTLGHDALFACATDCHSIYASPDGMRIDEESCHRSHAEYLRLFKLMHIHFDRYITTDNPAHGRNVLQVFSQLLDEKMVYRGFQDDSVCTQCGCSLPKRLLVLEENETHCPYCGGLVSKCKRAHYFLHLAGQEDDLRTFARNLSQKDVQNMVMGYARNTLKDWNLSRHNHLGIPIPYDEAQSIYLWFDSLVGYGTLANDRGVETDRVMHFIGKNIVYHHSVVYRPIAAKLFPAFTDIQLSVRGFLNTKETDEALLDIEELALRYDPDFIRFFLAYKVRDSIADYTFKESDLKAVALNWCCKKFTTFFSGIWQILQSCPTWREHVAGNHLKTQEFLEDFEALVFCGQVHNALHKLIAYVDELNALLPDRNSNQATTAYAPLASDLAYSAAVLQSLLSAYMPCIAQQYSIFDCWRPAEVSEANRCSQHALKGQMGEVHLYACQTRT